MWADSSNDDSWTPEVSKASHNVCVCVCVAVRVGDTPVISACQGMMMMLACCDRETGQSASFTQRGKETHPELLFLLKCVLLFTLIQK